MNNSNPALTLVLAEHAETIQKMPLSPELVRQVKRAALDFFCAAVTGSRSEVSQSVYRYLAANATGTFCAIGYDEGLSRTDTAFINGTSAHSLDFDDGHTYGSMHPGAVVFPAILAVSQHLRPTPEAFMKAVVLGYDVSLKIAAAMHPAARQRGFHNTSAAGIFGAAAASAFLYGADRERMLNTLGIAGSFAGGLFAFLGTGSEVKRVHPGQAARDGLMAAELAMAGLTGPHAVLEGNNGFFGAFAGNFNPDRILLGLGSEFEIMNIYFKPYPCCRHLHSAIDSIYEMKRRFAFSPEQVAKLRVGVNRLASLHNHKQCHSLLDAQMSLPFSVAAAIVHPALNIQSFKLTEASEELWRLCNLVEVVVDDRWERAYPEKRGATVTIQLIGGQILEHSVDQPLGEPSHPMSDEQLREKFMNNCSPILGEDRAADLCEGIEHLDRSLDFWYGMTSVSG